MSFSWWQQLVLTLLPLVLINVFFGASEPLLPELAMPLFIAGLLSMFVTLRTFAPYKHGLIHLQKSLDTAQEPAAWDELAHVRRRALLAAGLPAWIAALAVFVGLEGVPLLLLGLSTLVLFYLYRIPRQVG
nr:MULTISPECIES: MFS transporter [unclassified Pseudomonas]